MSWLRLVRWNNLLFIFFTYAVFRYFLFPFLGIETSLSEVEFLSFCCSIIAVTASGNVINDIYDYSADKVNFRNRPISKGEISSKNAYKFYFIIILFALIFVSYFSYQTENIWLVGVECCTIILLFMYAKVFKGIVLFSNVMVSFLVSLSIALLFLIELPFQIDTSSVNWIIFYVAFSFWGNLNREIIKDIQDIKGDYYSNYNTLPILLGKSRTNTILFVSTLLFAASILFSVKSYLYAETNIFIYFIFAVIAPLIGIAFHIFKYELQSNYKLMALAYKIVMFLGVLSVVLL